MVSRWRDGKVWEKRCILDYGHAAYEGEISLTIGRTLMLALLIFFALKTLVKAVDIVVFPDPGVPANATSIRRPDEAGFSSKSLDNLSHNVVIISSISGCRDKFKNEMNEDSALHGEDDLDY